ncbi:hypothetical protein ACPPVQ_00230 [Diaminobutyricibacter sp. McL0618]|uniref:hypothetical protein n=1 Tax=Leifsonia sp. McL0618 TaxID=3415677 RepID=UPI003CF5291D
MHSNIVATVGVEHPTYGAPSLVQGVYGARGNLELAACDVTDGLWVFWYNSDLADDSLEPSDVGPGAWSAGLRFAMGQRYMDAVILQGTLGPDDLEVLALDANAVLQSWYWSAPHGFQRRTTDAATDVASFAAEHDEGTLTVQVETRHGAHHLAVSGPSPYPERQWQQRPGERGRNARATTTPDAAVCAVLTASGISIPEVAPGTIRAADSNRCGGTTELTWRDAAGRIRHLGVPQLAR